MPFFWRFVLVPEGHRSMNEVFAPKVQVIPPPDTLLFYLVCLINETQCRLWNLCLLYSAATSFDRKVTVSFFSVSSMSFFSKTRSCSNQQKNRFERIDPSHPCLQPHQTTPSPRTPSRGRSPGKTLALQTCEGYTGRGQLKVLF